MTAYILTFRCPDGPGITHAITGALLTVEANILEQAQFTETTTNDFCLRTRFEAPTGDLAEVRQAVTDATAHLAPAITLRHEEHGAIVLRQGRYQQAFQVEDFGEEVRRVAD